MVYSQYTIIYKYCKRIRLLKSKKELKNFPSRNTMAASENRFSPEWDDEKNEKELIELLDATRGSIKKATKYGMKIFQGKNLKTLFFLFLFHPS